MKYDLKEDVKQERLGQFTDWLQSETISSLSRAAGEPEAIRAAVFLFINRAMEAHLPDVTIGEVLGVSAVRAGLTEGQQDLAFDEADGLASALKPMYQET